MTMLCVIQQYVKAMVQVLLVTFMNYDVLYHDNNVTMFENSVAML